VERARDFEYVQQRAVQMDWQQPGERQLYGGGGVLAGALL